MEEGVWETGYGNQWGVSLGVKLYLVRDVWVDFKSFVVLCNGASRNKNAAPYKQVRLLWMFYRHLELGMPKAKFSYFSLCYCLFWLAMPNHLSSTSFLAVLSNPRLRDLYISPFDGLLCIIGLHATYMKSTHSFPVSSTDVACVLAILHIDLCNNLVCRLSASPLSVLKFQPNPAMHALNALSSGDSYEGQSLLHKKAPNSDNKLCWSLTSVSSFNSHSPCLSAFSMLFLSGV